MPEAHFIGGPLNGQFKKVDGSRREILTPIYPEAEVFLRPDEAPETVTIEKGVYRLEAWRTGAGLSAYQNLVYLYQGTEKEIAESRKAEKRRRIMGAFMDVWMYQYKNDKTAYYQNAPAMKEAMVLLDKALA